MKHLTIELTRQKFQEDNALAYCDDYGYLHASWLTEGGIVLAINITPDHGLSVEFLPDLSSYRKALLRWWWLEADEVLPNGVSFGLDLYLRGPDVVETRSLASKAES